MSARAGLLALLLACGCQSVDFGPDEPPARSTACVEGSCPAGTLCVNGVCVTPEAPIVRDSGAPEDAGREDAGRTPDAGEPGDLSCTTRFTDVAVGNDAACALTEAGAVWCWGLNNCGQLGEHPGVDANPVPLRVDVPPLARLSGRVDDHVCGLTDAGALYCWGCDYAGMLAGHTGGPGAPVDGETYVDVATRWAGTCAVRDGGALFCWGDDANGQLGGCAPEGASEQCTPTAFASPTSFTRIALSSRHGCGVSGGEIWCWGKNDAGQLGRGFVMGPEPLAPAQVTGAGLAPPADLTVGINHTCVIDAAGELYCWGQNTDGQLGLGDHQRQSSPVRVSAGWARVRGGISHTCAIDDAGALFCWGRNGGGRLGVGDETERSSPTRVDAAHTYVAVDGGSTSSCGVRSDGRVYCWGLNDHGKLGTGSADEGLELHVPTPIACGG